MFRRTFSTIARTVRSVSARPAAGAGMVAVAGAPVAARIAGSRLPALLPAAAAFGVAAALALSEPAHAAGVDYDKVREAIAAILDQEGYDDGSLGPVLVRLAWHASGTYSVFSKDGGSDGATMRFHPECADGANAGLHIARKALEPVLAQFPGLSRADLWTLAGVVAIEEMGGPKIEWRSGRTDATSGKACPPTGRLPNADRGADHIRAVFYRMGFNDREIVALVGAHAVGRCHTDRSGFDGPWTFSPTTFSNEFFRLMLEETWVPRQWNGPQQYQDKGSRSLMMLPADLALVRDDDFRQYVELYAKDEAAFFKDFSAAFSKLIHLGVGGGDDKKAGGLCGFC